jgi:hypothetical protein
VPGRSRSSRIDAGRSRHTDLAGDRGAGDAVVAVGVVAGEAAELVAGELSRLSVQTLSEQRVFIADTKSY